ncbi:hypothetical protein GSY37_14510 [Listeria monocytogenes]|nr:hypothetical protein [Listeria monocytogenes]
MNRVKIMKEYQQKLEGIYRQNYTVETPLLQAYDAEHPPFDSMDIRLQTISQMDRNGTVIPKETLGFLSNQLISISANYSVEEQQSFLRNEGRQIKMAPKAISIRLPEKTRAQESQREQEEHLR